MEEFPRVEGREPPSSRRKALRCPGPRSSRARGEAYGHRFPRRKPGTHPRQSGGGEEGRGLGGLADARASSSREGAGAASIVFRETPLVYREPTGRLVEGVPDLVFRDEDSEWTLLDFKTDLRLDIAEVAHRSQVALYRLALEEATGIRAEGWLLYI